jgi:ATP-dependent Lhr-like helicase
MSNLHNNHQIHHWFASKRWKILPFQKEAWDRYEEGKSGLISVPTGAGKTYAAYLPALARLHKKPGKGIQILYVTPLKALAKDLEYALKKPVDDLGLPYRVEKRTGDISASHKNKQKKNPPEILLITPESLALLLTEKDAATKFGELQTIIVDEWHELLSSKRGTLLELCLARLKKWSLEVQIWGLTATIGNLKQAAQVCVGSDRTPCIITAKMTREVIIESILPDSIEKLPWAGYLGMPMLPYVLKQLSPDCPTLIFTNTRSQAERWYQAILEGRPEWENLIALHHSAIDKKSRERIEEEIKEGVLRFVVCTSTLDLGIDLPVVEKVIQIGSPKSVSRLIQRAGRSSHKPLTPCRIAIVPTHALEVIEIKGYRMALSQHIVEERIPLKKCYDVLLQHLTTCAIGGGFDKYEFFKEVKTCVAFEDLTFFEFENCLQFLISGGKSLDAYPEYKKLILQDGLYVVTDAMIIRRHKMNIGTISSDPYVAVQFAKGKTIGIVEESFLTQLKAGDSFLFAGKNLQLVQYRDLIAYVRLTKNSSKQTAVWRGSRLPFSAPLGEIIRKVFAKEKEEGIENQFLQGILHLQSSISHLPKENELLIEKMKSKEGWHLFVYPFEGKTIHEGLAKLMAHRLTKANPSTLTVSCNDYGFELVSSKPFDEKLLQKIFSFSEENQEEIQDLMNMHEASKGSFRDIARIAGLIFSGFPRKHKSSRQIQMSTALLFEVLQKYDPDNLLIEQAKREVLERQFEKGRLIGICKRLSSCRLVIKTLQKFTPFSLPLFIERVNGHLSSESLLERVKNIQKSWTSII